MERIGPYRLVRIIGEGGMGLVWEAKQSFPVEREIALKVVRQGISAPGLVERFDAERRSLAKMSHRGIVRVFEAGESEGGQLYFAMELVSGVPLNDYCTEKKLSLHRRLELFLEVVLAVRHAHQKGVLHRDLKPSNILVSEDEEGRPFSKLIDFGIAKAVAEGNRDATLLTMPGQVVGTPQYMSPEQAGGGEVDTRTDVYGLGAVLYELISGSPPLPAERIASASTEEVLRMVREFEPERPSVRMDRRGAGSARTGEGGHRWRRDLREELDWIALRCIEKDPDRRYESVDGLVDDLRRHLEGSPVSARPPSRVYRARKFVRRNRLLVGSSLAVLAALSTATALSMRWAFAAEASRRLAEARLAQENAVPEFLFKAFRHAGESGAGTNMLALDVLRQAEKDVAVEFAEQPLILARLQESIGLAYQRLGRADLAAPVLNSALALFRGVPGNEESARRLALPATSTLRVSGMAETAVAPSEAEWQEREKSLGEDHPQTHAARLDHCRSLLEVAYWRDELRDDYHQRVDALVNEVLRAPHRFPQAKVRDYEAIAAQLAAGRGDHAAALAFWDAEMDRLFLEGTARRTSRYWPGSFHVGALLRNGRLEDATAAAESLVLHCRDFLGRRHGDTAKATRHLAGLYRMLESPGGAYLVCRMLQPEPDEQVDPLFAEGLDRLAQWSEQLEIADEEQARLRDLVAEMKSGESRATPEEIGAAVGERAEILFWFAELCWARDRRDEALSMAEAAYEKTLSRHGADHVLVSVRGGRLVEMWLQTANWKRADAILSAQLQKPAAEMSWRNGIVLELAMDLADHYAEAKDDEAAVRLARRVAAIRTERGLMDPGSLNRYCRVLHGAAVRKQSPAALVEMYEEVVPVHADSIGAGHRNTLVRRMWHANALVDSGRADEALEKIGEFHAQNKEWKQPDLPWRITEGRALTALGRFDEARAILEGAWQECLDLGFDSPKADATGKQSAHRTASSLVTLSERAGRTEERLKWLRIRDSTSPP